jgi:hypothetical protein
MHHVVMWAFVSTLIVGSAMADGPNQTTTFSPIEDGGVPFSVELEEVVWTGDALPTIQSTSYARYDHELVFIGGRTSGVHGFDCDPDNNFMPKQFNESIFVVDYLNEHVYMRPLSDGDLTEFQIADLSSTNKLFFHESERLLMVGGYGHQHETPPKGGEWLGCPVQADSRFQTYDTMKVVDLAGVIAWVKGDASELSSHISFFDAPVDAPDLFRITGGTMLLVEDEYWLCLGHSYDGGYIPGCACPTPAQQIYTKSIRRFAFDPDDPASVPVFLGETDAQPDWARRRDLNVLPVRYGEQDRGAVALSGVFTEQDGIWTVPITIRPDGTMDQADPDAEDTFRQGFNIYHSATMNFWSSSQAENWMLVFGGMGYQVLESGVLTEDAFIPYSNEVLAVRFAPGELLEPDDDEWSQHFPGASFPAIIDETIGLPYYFGSEMSVMPVIDHDWYIYDLDDIDDTTHVAYIYGGIVSPGQNRSEQNYRATYASNRIFKVLVSPIQPCPADIFDTGTVDVFDMLAVTDEWGCVGECMADVNDDGVVDVLDLLLVISEWGPCQ